MHDERTLEQMVQVLADFDIESGVRVLQDDVLFGFEESFGVERFAGSGFGEGVNVGPFRGGCAAGRGTPFLSKGVAECSIGEEL
jgi:hypothetical protein